MLFTLPDRAALPDDVESLKDLVLEVMRRASIAAQEASHSIERLELQLVALRRVVFGVRSERLAGQADLFALTSTAAKSGTKTASCIEPMAPRSPDLTAASNGGRTVSGNRPRLRQH